MYLSFCGAYCNNCNNQYCASPLIDCAPRVLLGTLFPRGHSYGLSYFCTRATLPDVGVVEQRCWQLYCDPATKTYTDPSRVCAHIGNFFKKPEPLTCEVFEQIWWWMCWLTVTSPSTTLRRASENGVMGNELFFPGPV